MGYVLKAVLRRYVCLVLGIFLCGPMSSVTIIASTKTVCDDRVGRETITNWPSVTNSLDYDICTAIVGKESEAYTLAKQGIYNVVEQISCLRVVALMRDLILSRETSRYTDWSSALQQLFVEEKISSDDRLKCIEILEHERMKMMEVQKDHIYDDAIKKAYQITDPTPTILFMSLFRERIRTERSSLERARIIKSASDQIAEVMRSHKDGEGKRKEIESYIEEMSFMSVSHLMATLKVSEISDGVHRYFAMYGAEGKYGEQLLCQLMRAIRVRKENVPSEDAANMVGSAEYWYKFWKSRYSGKEPLSIYGSAIEKEYTKIVTAEGVKDAGIGQ